MTTQDRQTIHALLNRIIGRTWTASAQHTAHVALLENWGLKGLADAMRAHIVDEPETIKKTLARLVELDGTPAFELQPVHIGGNLREVLANDMAQQQLVPGVLNEAVELTAKSHDATTRRLIEGILADEEEHLDWLKTELELLDRLGDALYAASRLAPRRSER